MKAMIFAAGLGTRLRPLTNTCPKALVKVAGTPLLEIAIKRLLKYGFSEIIINIHYLGAQIIDFLTINNNFGASITLSDERDLLLNTGGGLKKVACFFDDGQPFLVCNVDVLTNLDLHKFYQQHLQSGALASLAVRNRQTSRYLLFDDDTQLVGWKNVKTKETRWVGQLTEAIKQKAQLLAFSGLHVVNPEIFAYMQSKGAFSIIQTYLLLAAQHKILAYPHNDSLWLDVGKHAQLTEAHKMLENVDF